MDCPKCRKKMEKGHKCHAPQVIQVNSPCNPTTFHTVELSSETEFPVANGAYKNTLVKYVADSSVYLYNSDGIPVSLTPDAIRNFNQLINRPKYNGVEMTSATDIPDLTSDVATLTSGLADEVLARQQEDNTISDAINKVVMTDLEVDPSPSSTVVQLDTTKTNIKTGATTTGNISLPVASTTQAGVMNSATFNAVAANASDIQALMNGAVAIAGLSASPSQSDLTTAWEAETGLAELMNRAGIYDIDNDKVWTYYSNTTTWYPASNTAQVTVNTFTNNSEGVIKGSTNVGQVFAESDGTGSINGWDALSGTVADHTSQIAAKANSADLATVATTGSYLNLVDTPTAVSAFANDVGYATENYVENRMEDTWQLIGESVLEADTTASDPGIEVSIPGEWEGIDVDYKFVLSLEHIGEDVEAYPYLRVRNAGGWMDCHHGYMKMEDGTISAYGGQFRTHFGFEWHILHSYDSCVAEGVVADPNDGRRYWNISCTAGGVCGGEPATYCGGGRSGGGDILGFGLYSNTPITWSAGSFLSIYAKRRSTPTA